MSNVLNLHMEDNAQENNENALNFIRKFPDKRINYLEQVLGEGDTFKGQVIISSLLKFFINKGFLPSEIGKIFNRDRHTIHEWCKRYEIELAKYEGFKKSIFTLTTDKGMHEVNHPIYGKVNDETYRIYQVHLNPQLAYFIGLILGDGHADDRKVYLVGGKPYDFLDKIYPLVEEVVNYLGKRSIKVLYYTNDDDEVERDSPNASYWRIYIYWSALSNFFRNKELLRSSLQIIWSNEELFNSFTAGLFDTDGYFTEKYGKPERIELEQSNKKWWFPDYCQELKKRYDTTQGTRKRKYKIIRRGKVYSGLSESTRIGLKQSSWPSFIEDVIEPYSNKILYENKKELFKNHALNNKNRWHIWRKL